MSSGLNGSGDAAAPSELSSLWHARVKARQEAQFTSGAPVRVDLPGGTPVMAIRANVLSLFEAGRIPDAITPFVLDLLKAGREKGEGAVTKLLTDGYADWVRLMDSVWLTSVREPAFVPDGTLSDDAIPMRLVPIEDKIAFFNWANGVPDYLDAFRQPGDDARASHDGEGVRDSSGPDVGSGPLAGTVTRLPVDAGNVLRGPRGRKQNVPNEAGSGTDAGTAAEGVDLGSEKRVDLLPGGRAGKSAGGSGRSERRSNRGTRAAAAT